MKKNKKGFTIVELVIVIAVIGILAAVLIPTFSTVVTNANKSAALSNCRNALTEVIAMDEYGEVEDGTILSAAIILLLILTVLSMRKWLKLPPLLKKVLTQKLIK